MKISVTNFQSLASAAIEATGLTVIVGLNNRGKSALIRAIVGALFNRPGTSYVRKGEKVARVELTDVPTHQGPPIQVVWEKGEGVNRFEVNGEKFTNVKRTAPQPLLDAGYRDLTLDDKTTVRPQVSGQFDPIFLLNASGGTISEVLTLASRLDILLRANASCMRDLRSQKQLLGLRRTDLTKAQTALDTIEAPIVDLQRRVLGLQAQAMEAQALRMKVEHLEILVARRKRLLGAAQADLPFPVNTSVAYAWQTQVETLTRATQVRMKLQAVQADLLPEVQTGEFYNDAAKAARLALLVDQYRRARAVQDVALPPEVPRLDLETPATMVRQLELLAPKLYSDVLGVRTAEAAFSAAGQDLEEASANVQNFLGAQSVCPACRQPTAGYVGVNVEELLG